MKPTEKDILESATKLVEAILGLDVLDAHKRDVINGMLWSITQARGKYATRFRSTAACAAPKGTKLQHEHVIPRKELVAAIMNEPARTREILSTAIACTVTAEEHKHLTLISRQQPHLKEWDRYRAAGITWRDLDDDGG